MSQFGASADLRQVSSEAHSGLWSASDLIGDCEWRWPSFCVWWLPHCWWGRWGWLGHIPLTIQSECCEAYGGPGAELPCCNSLHILSIMESHKASPYSRDGEIATLPPDGGTTKCSVYFCLLSYPFSLKEKWLTGMSSPVVLHCTIYAMQLFFSLLILLIADSLWLKIRNFALLPSP